MLLCNFNSQEVFESIAFCVSGSEEFTANQLPDLQFKAEVLLISVSNENLYLTDLPRNTCKV